MGLVSVLFNGSITKTGIASFIESGRRGRLAAVSDRKGSSFSYFVAVKMPAIVEKRTPFSWTFVHPPFAYAVQFRDGATPQRLAFGSVCAVEFRHACACNDRPHNPVAACVTRRVVQGIWHKASFGAEHRTSGLRNLNESQTPQLAPTHASFFRRPPDAFSPTPTLQVHAEGLICLTGCRKGVISQMLQGRYEDVVSHASGI